jgi:hypothetical protein
MKDSCIIGRKELGKTTMAFYQARLNAPYIIIYDGCCQFQIFPSASDPKKLGKLMQMTDDDGQLLNPIVYQPEGEALDNFAVFADACWRSGRRPMAIIVDEAGELQGPGSMEPKLSRLIRQAHRYQMCVIQTCHRPPDLHRRSWALASQYIFFRTTDQRDLERIEEHCGHEVAARVAQLARFHCIVWDENMQTFEVWVEPARWYVDIHGNQLAASRREGSSNDAGTAPANAGERTEELPSNYTANQLEEAYRGS